MAGTSLKLKLLISGVLTFLGGRSHVKDDPVSVSL